MKRSSYHSKSAKLKAILFLLDKAKVASVAPWRTDRPCGPKVPTPGGQLKLHG